MPTAPIYDAEALYRQFLDNFPVLTALDRLCWKCGRQIWAGFGRDDVAQRFSVTFQCHSVEYTQLFNYGDVTRGGLIDRDWAQLMLGLIRGSERS